MKVMNAALLVMLTAWVAPSMAQTAGQKASDTPADNMQILRDKVKADKKLVVAANMDLTEAEAKKFWPVYDAYQAELEKINKRTGALIAGYAADFRAGTFTDDKAKKAIDEMTAIEEAEAKFHKSFVPKLNQALPARKAARYMQIENKIRAAIKYELAVNIPLAP
ncbi:MAG: hypothetical protein JSW09_07875 [Pseudomonadota bacterium]|nr:MAG: hypothetical protein JSW09_07875 [Pseudomonadota bacterium]